MDSAAAAPKSAAIMSAYLQLLRRPMLERRHNYRQRRWSASASTSSRPLAAVDASLHTHLYYPALAVHPTTHKLVLPTDPDQASLLAGFSPALRTLRSVGITAVDSQTDPAFAAMAVDPTSRAAFVTAAVALARDSGFDRLVVAWQFPASAVEMADVGFLVSECPAAALLGFLLNATVYISSHVFGAPLPGVDYSSEAVARCLDWVNVVVFGLPSLLGGAGAAMNATTAGLLTWLAYMARHLRRGTKSTRI